MKYSKENEILGLPENFKFGIEIEAYNVDTKGKNGLYKGTSAEYIRSKNWHMASQNEEMLVSHGGAELVSPILKDTKQDWDNLEDICSHIKKYPGNNGDKVVADEKCGLHVHFDADCLAKDPEKMKTFLRLYAESEELIYKMCNEKGNILRKGAINKNYKGLTNLIAATWRNGMAAPSGKNLLKKIETGKLKLSYKKFGKLRMLASKYKIDERRYQGLNLTNIGNSKKNTIEFRMANGTLDPEVIKQNIFLYSSLINTSIKATENKEEYENKLDGFYNTDKTEKEKAEEFLNLIIENPQDRNIYMERWESVKEQKIFASNDKKGFAQNRFKRDELKNIALRTPLGRVKETYLKIKDMIGQKVVENNTRREDVNDR